MQKSYFRITNGEKKVGISSKSIKFLERKEIMEKVKKTAKIWLCIAIALMLLSAIVVSFVQTDGGKVEMQELMVETELGYTMSAYIFTPETATSENPAPAVVVSHGYLNNKEMAELSRKLGEINTQVPVDDTLEDIKKKLNNIGNKGVALSE